MKADQRAALEKLCKWRTVLAGWHHGTRAMSEPGTKAMRDLMEKWLLMRAENNAMTGLLLAKGVFTAAEYDAALAREAALLDEDMERLFPGFQAMSTGLRIDPRVANETMERLGFPP